MMAIKKRKTTLMMFVALAIAGLTTDFATAQLHVPGPRYRPRPNQETDATRPFAEPGIFDYDAQVFAPLEFTNGKEKAPNTGFFFTLTRTYLSIGGGGGDVAGLQVQAPSGDYQWGNRYEFGFMTEEDHGWDLIWTNSNGSSFTNGRDTLVSNPMLVRTKFNSFELNKIFRQQLSEDTYFEPYLGLRYFGVSDNTLEDSAFLFNGVNFPNRFKQNASNNAGGIQAGGRYNRRFGRWRMTVDGAVATTYNQQTYFSTDIITNPATGAIGVTESSTSSSAFVPAVDLSFEIAYNISRDLSLRTGLTGMYLWDGMTRANTATTTLNPNSNLGTVGVAGIIDDSVSAVGFSIGVEWRR